KARKREKMPSMHSRLTRSGLITRWIPQWSSVFQLNIAVAPNGMDFFTLENSASGGISITGNTGVSLAMGLNWYLKYYANCSFSWGWDGSGNQVCPRSLFTWRASRLIFLCVAQPSFHYPATTKWWCYYDHAKQVSLLYECLHGVFCFSFFE